jgi:predicted flap endonuclease-1-like 5' DNA nuclease
MVTKYKAKTEGKERVAMTEAEVAEHAIHVQTATEHDEAVRAERLVQKAKLASGKAKLKELGLDDDELKQILGI